MTLNTLNISKIVVSSNSRNQNKLTMRDRTNSCKVAIKNVFPRKKFEIAQNHPNIFEREDESLSTIPGCE